MIFLGGQKASQRPHFAEQSIVGYTFVLAVSSIMLFRPKICLRSSSWFEPLTTARKSIKSHIHHHPFSHKKGIKKPPIILPPTSFFAVKLSSFTSWLRHQLHLHCYLNIRKRKSRRTPVNVIYLLVLSDFLYAKKNHQHSPKNQLSWSSSENSGFFTLSVFAYTNKTRRRNPFLSSLSDRSGECEKISLSAAAYAYANPRIRAT